MKLTRTLSPLALLAAGACADVSAPLPTPERTTAALSDERGRMALLGRLRESSRDPVRLRMRGEGVEHASLRVPVEGADPATQAHGLLDTYALLFGVQSRELSFGVRSVRTERALTDVRLHQRYGRLPVFGADAVVTMAGGEARAVASHLWSGPTRAFSTTPRISVRDALGVARREARDPEAPAVSETRLVVLVPSVLDPALAAALPREAYLAYHVNVRGERGAWSGLVDARDGRVLLALATEQSDYHLDLEDANGGTAQTTTCYYEMFEGSNAANENQINSPYQSDDEVVTLWSSADDVYDYFYSRWQRDSWNNEGATLQLFAHSSTPNASWVSGCNVIQFRDPFVGRDVLGHEYTHGVIQDSSNLVYQNQSGALNESFADIFGEMIDDDGAWLVGDDTPNGVLREMADPSAPVAGGNTQPDTFSAYVPLPFGQVPTGGTGGNDWGFVHTNSGIQNQAAFFIADGGTQNGVTVSGIGREPMAALAYGVMGTLPSSASYQQAADAWIARAETYVDYGVMTPWQVCQVRNAWAAVELASPDTDCDGILDGGDDDDDGDGVLDVDDNCVGLESLNQSDEDGDGLGDPCDGDDDGDGVLDGVDNCPHEKNADQKDLNDDDIGDACQDPDGDGVPSWKDNCPDDENPGQENQDGDDDGDVCDMEQDHDGDDVWGLLDNCPFTANADQSDGDSDGLGDACDPCAGADEVTGWSMGIPGVTNPHPILADADSDGEPDGCDATPNGECEIAIDGLPFAPEGGITPGGTGGASITVSGRRGLTIPVLLFECGDECVGESARRTIALDGLANASAWVTDETGRMVASSANVRDGRAEMRFTAEGGRRYALQIAAAPERARPIRIDLRSGPRTPTRR
ncbi:MAG: M4 family metallopeptidase [Deltaproteobacteria bacterium]|nr:M4 family metallopeptidase [Deltaproteobacteria bacterium]